MPLLYNTCINHDCMLLKWALPYLSNEWIGQLVVFNKFMMKLISANPMMRMTNPVVALLAFSCFKTL